MTIYYVCDTCGTLADVSDEPHPAGELWECDKCQSTSLWAFDRLEKALQHSHDIFERTQQ